MFLLNSLLATSLMIATPTEPGSEPKQTEPEKWKNPETGSIFHDSPEKAGFVEYLKSNPEALWKVEYALQKEYGHLLEAEAKKLELIVSPSPSIGQVSCVIPADFELKKVELQQNGEILKTWMEVGDKRILNLDFAEFNEGSYEFVFTGRDGEVRKSVKLLEVPRSK